MRKNEKPAVVICAGAYLARDNAQTILGSQRKSLVLFVLQLIQLSGLFYIAGSGCRAAEDVDRKMI
jgi:hypothetical protein